MRKDIREGVFGGKRHEAAEKFFRFTDRGGFRPDQGEGARPVRAAKEVQLEFFASPPDAVNRFF